jgi:F-type H+-transporting ATPase subunit b
MPQLAFADYPPQVVWLVITFAVLYALLSGLVLPRIARTLGARDTRLSEDLARAEKLKAEAEATLAAYEQSIGAARAKAQAEIKQVADAMAAEAAKREAALAADIAARTRTAEAGVLAAKQAALADLRSLAGDAASQLVARLAGAAPPAAEVTEAVEAARREQA